MARALLASLAAIVVLFGAIPAAAGDVIPVEDASASTGRVPDASTLVLCRWPACDPDDGGGGGQPGPIGCDLGLSSKTVSRGDNPEFGGAFSRITWRATLGCTGGFGLQSATLRTYVVDRTAGHRDGQAISQIFQISKPVISPGLGLQITVDGFVDLFDTDHPNGQEIEIILEDIEQTSGVVLQCNPSASPELRLISCMGNHSLWGSRNFVSEVAPFCPRGSWVATLGGRPFDQRHLVTLPPLPGSGEVSGPVLARPLVRTQWCADNNGNVTKMQVIATSPDRLVSELDGRTVGNTQAVQTSRDGKIAYELHFDFEYQVNKDFAIGPFALKFGTKCTVNIHLIYTDRPAPRNETINVCDPWRVGGS